jgi:DNA repair protein RadC
MWDMTKIDLLEQVKLLLLNRHFRCLGISHIATGGTASCVVDPRLIFITALKANATNIILAHNHPSGNLKPSEADKQLTGQLVEAGKFLQIGVRDHLILSSTGYFSMADEGLMPG